MIRLSSLGDIVLAQSLCTRLRALYPAAEIDFITKPQYLELVSLMGCGLNAIAYDKSLGLHWVLRRKRYDLVIDLHAKLSSFLIRLAAAGKLSTVYRKQRSVRRRIVAGDKSLAIGSTVELYQSALSGLGISEPLAAPFLIVPDLQLPFDLPPAAKVIMLFPGAAHYTKRYPIAGYKDLLLHSPDDYYYLLAGSRAEYSLCEEICSESRGKSLNLAGLLSFGQILKAMQLSTWVITSDSGPMHLAAAISRPQIAIFGATHPRLGFAPMNPNARLLCLNLDCQPCSLHGTEKCPQGHFKCMLDVTPDSILAILR
ncbi:MAG TPA: glycosyltransferase family 9 protein [Candidatus Cloacimonadota bacterium]|nr:glycosyltransferase family 9 protein [Candidatus Cloacimonadota bacterium]